MSIFQLLIVLHNFDFKILENAVTSFFTSSIDLFDLLTHSCFVHKHSFSFPDIIVFKSLILKSLLIILTKVNKLKISPSRYC